jgi:hypothetical protein
VGDLVVSEQSYVVKRGGGSVGVQVAAEAISYDRSCANGPFYGTVYCITKINRTSLGDTV